MAPRRKFYVVWIGHSPGIYDSWEECQAQTKNFPGARYKAFDTQEAATAAYRGNPDEQKSLLKAIAKGIRRAPADYSAFPEIDIRGIAVDGACAKNPGPMEYQGVHIASGRRLFHFGPVDNGTNNIAEYLALVHALAALDKAGDRSTPVYSDSLTARSWVKNRGHKSKVARNAATEYIHSLLDRADRWLQTHPAHNPVLKWDTDRWGEIPADFGRK